jgi:intracellular septation protein
MKQILDFIPLIIFFAVYKLQDIYAATGALIIATAIALAFTWVRYRKVEKMQLVTFIMVLGFGSLTLALHDDVFIKWKVTVIYGLFAAALLVSQFFFKAPLVKKMLGKEFVLPDTIWNRLNLAWAGFFSTCGALNVYVAFNLSQETWVNFKVFGLLVATLAFTLASILYLYKYLPEDQKDKISKKED